VFVDAKPSAAAVVVEGGRFLAVRRARPPAAGGWDLPGGFCDADHPTVAAVREVKEETGLAVTLGPLVGLYMGTYEYDGRVVPTLNVYYLARLAGGVERPEPGEVSGIDWFELADPPPLAFAHQGEMIGDAERLAAGWVVS
jgi:ADP-ribose pyrophosphatase YjhB (NUDIX family)